jgi:hypothetical protein
LAAQTHQKTAASVEDQLEKIPVTTVSDLPAPDFVVKENGYDQLRKRVVRFERLTPEQSGQLQSFIYSYAK